jgi:cell division protein FtsB
MTDLEDRVTTLEREMTALKARVDTVEEDAKNIPDLIKTEFRLSNSQIARLSRDVAELRELPAKVDALPRVVAELVVEMLAERDRKN